MSDPEIIDTPLGPIRIHVVDGLPDNEILFYSPPVPGSHPATDDEPAHPAWVPLERRAVKVVLD